MKYRKKPVVIEAVQWTGDNFDEVSEFTNGALRWDDEGLWLIIPTLEGDHLARVGDFIIQGVHGEFYPCKPDIFEKTYERVEALVHIAGKPDYSDDPWSIALAELRGEK